MQVNLISHLEGCIDVFEDGGEDDSIRVLQPLFACI